MRMNFRSGFYAGLLAATILGLFLFQLWQPEKQIQLHSRHLLRALEEKDWARVGKFIDPSYRDQWGNDRALLLARLRELLRSLRNLHFDELEVGMSVGDMTADWRARITVEAEANELSVLIKERVNSVEEPFAFRWRRKSGKPWDWQLVAVSNEGLQLSAAAD